MQRQGNYSYLAAILAFALSANNVAAAADNTTFLSLRHASDLRNLFSLANGWMTEAGVSVWRKCLSLVTAEKTHLLLSRPVEPLSPSNFRPASRMLEIAAPTGILQIPNVVRTSTLVLQARSILDSRFDLLVTKLQLTNGAALPQVDIAEARDSLKSWARAAEEVSTAMEKVRIGEFELAVSRLLDRLESDQHRRQYADFLIHKGHRFEGGTVGSLIDFVLDRRISCRRGSPAAAYMAETARCLADELQASELRIAETSRAAVAGRAVNSAPLGESVSNSALAKDVHTGSRFRPSATYVVPTQRTYTYRRYYYIVR